MCRITVDHANAQLNKPTCPFTLRNLNSTTYLIRENDGYGEYPHIYVKRYSQTDAQGNPISVLLVNDTGVGTTAPTSDDTVSAPLNWTIKSFLDHNFNADGKTPYLVVLSHCHFDHILGLNSLLPAGKIIDGKGPKAQNGVTVLASSYEPSFLQPHSVLEEHSLCNDQHLSTPIYTVSIWANNAKSVVFKHPSGTDMELPILTFHTPGHTPDSLSWYDTEERSLYVGDSLYERQSDNTRNAPWGSEHAAPIIFPKESSLLDWWQSIKSLQSFVEKENSREEKRVTLSAGHVTTSVDAETCLARVKEFVARILRDEVPFTPVEDRRGEAFGHWIDDSDSSDGKVREFSVAAPVRVVEEGREKIPRGEWESV